MTFVLIFASCLLFNTMQALQIAACSSTIIFGLDVYITLRNNKRHFERNVRTTPGVTGQHTVSLSSEGVHRLTPIAEIRVDWKGYKKIQHSDDGINFYIGPSIAHCVPADAFSRADEVETFYHQVCEYWEAAKSGRQMPNLGNAEEWPPPPTGRS